MIPTIRWVDPTLPESGGWQPTTGCGSLEEIRSGIDTCIKKNISSAFHKKGVDDILSDSWHLPKHHNYQI